MNTTSPSKRRALAPVDANIRSPAGAPRLSPSKLDLPKSTMALDTNPIEASATKRAIEQESDQDTSDSAKKRRLSSAITEPEPASPRNQVPLQKEVDDTQTPRSMSPEEPSVFDNSTIDNSQVTIISEPDVETTAAPVTTPVVVENRPRGGSMTREEARQVSLLPPFLAASPRSLAAVSQGGEEKRLSSPARIEAATPRAVLTIASSPIRRESISSMFYADMDRSPMRRLDPEQMLPPVGLNTPQRALANRDDEFLDNERGGAAEGLLSLSQSSPASVLR
ncbi:hypothetical protein ONZ43_g875 [Nemania bipapillata]|uniref:Uncharacterized protein n=1 Tax=Nemania bipapillata TaxID=110536 RepID=A0ACC2J6T4_9PEZI|nr:hypothetical protein ONZ43_g875 [Nemania bipapillata]